MEKKLDFYVIKIISVSQQWVVVLKSLGPSPPPVSDRDLLQHYFSINCIVLFFLCRFNVSRIHSCMCYIRIQFFTFLHIVNQFSQHHLLNNQFFLQWWWCYIYCILCSHFYIMLYYVISYSIIYIGQVLYWFICSFIGTIFGRVTPTFYSSFYILTLLILKLQFSV